MGEYRLSAVLNEHDDDIRGVVFPNPSFVLSASRDATVRIWKLLASNPPAYDCTISSHVQSFVNAITYLSPSSEYPEGLVISGGKDTLIDVRQPNKSPEAGADALLAGHANNVCALDVSPDGKFIVSGSWDNTARVWSLGKWECEAVLEGHGASVWTVLIYDRRTIITGCADKTIRLFDTRGKKYGDIKGSTDVVRALCRVPSGHPSEADFASAGNDGIIRLWKLSGKEVGQLHGHESFIYSLVSLPTGELVSSGEDRTVRIWRGNGCIQTITHPAISVWGVAACEDNGDIVSGASDKIVRIFTRDKERQAAPAMIRDFEDSVKSSSIPKQQVGEINKEKLPGPDFLQNRSGTKEGQVQMIQEPNGSVSAHQWSQAAQSWLNVGTVVDAAGSSGRKTSYVGKDYDYVFDVDIEDGKPPLKLPYNLSQNAYEAATKFLQDNELPLTYLDQVAGFITTNSQGATMGQTQAPAGADPWGSENRYRPGDANAAASAAPQPASRPKVLPQKTYLAIKNATLRTILKKITEFNEQLVQEGSKDIACKEQQLEALEAASKSLEVALASKASSDATITALISPVLNMLSDWPPAMRLPVLDLARLLTAASPDIFTFPGGRKTIPELLISSGLEDMDRQNNIMLAIRGLGNSFETNPGRDQMDAAFDKVHSAVKKHTSSMNRNVLIAIATLYINYAVLYSRETRIKQQSSTDRALVLADDLTKIIGNSSDSEAVYRSLVAIGTLTYISIEVHMAARDIFGLPAAMERAEQNFKEPRIISLIDEIRQGFKDMV